MKVSIVIPNYNGSLFLENCMKAIDSQDYDDYDIIVVDDASTDEGTESIVSSFPKARLIKHEENKGFAASVNDGIKASDSKYVFLLNNDAYLDEGCLKVLVDSMENDAASSDIFSIQCKMISAKNRALIDSAGDFYNIFGYARSRGKDKLTDSYEKPTPIFSACAGAALYRRDVLLEIGLFDESHFAYLEDVDIGYRAKLFGYTNKYEPLARVFHEGSATSGSRYNEFKCRLAARNSVLVRYKNQTPFQKVVNFIPMEFGVMVKRIYFAKKGLGSAYKDGIKEGRRMIKDPAFSEKKVVFDKEKRKRARRIEWELIKNIIY